MEPSLPILPQAWADRILTAVLWMVGGGTLFKLIQLIVNKANRNAAVAKSHADAALVKVDTLTKYENLLGQLQDRINHVEATSDDREKHCQERLKFLETSLGYNRQMLSAYIRRGHAFGGELAKLVMYIKNRDIDMATAIEKIKAMQNHQGLPDGMGSQLTELIILITPREMRLKTAEDLTAAIPLPTPPDGVDPLHDSGEYLRPD
jgi:hypothetical protein